MPLARYLPPGYPLYGLQARGMDGTSVLPASVREMAADYVEQIRAVQPAGPYYLLGMSFGGVPAHEIAVQLQAAGEDVGALIMLDSYPEGRRDAAHAGVISEPDWQGPQMRHVLDAIRRESAHVLGAMSDEEVEVLARIFRNNARMMRVHEPGFLDGDILVIAAVKNKHESVVANNFLRWKSYVSGTVAEFRVPCAHADLLRTDNLSTVWQGMAAWLNLEDAPCE
jgi:thioesterase domain-containing protein